jgi:hypothetical protein
LYAHEHVVAIVENFYHAFAGVAWVELADEDPLNAFLDEKWHRACITHVRLFAGSVC